MEFDILGEHTRVRSALFLADQVDVLLTDCHELVHIKDAIQVLRYQPLQRFIIGYRGSFGNIKAFGEVCVVADIISCDKPAVLFQIAETVFLKYKIILFHWRRQRR